MVDFAKLLNKASEDASKLPSFPQKDKTYHINAQTPDFSAHIDVVKMANTFGKMVERTQTVYYINTREGILRVSPNQIQQLQALLANCDIDPKQTWLPIATKDSASGLVFDFASEFDKEVKYKRIE